MPWFHSRHADERLGPADRRPRLAEFRARPFVAALVTLDDGRTRASLAIVVIGRPRFAAAAAAAAARGAALGFADLVAARARQAAFGALLAPSASALLTSTFADTREQGKALGTFTVIVGRAATTTAGRGWR
ncbi:MAG TPA: hypothetical protein VFQ44_15910 [Streptosporangiaceae bacterium]|nr:hypothetical protein [Streptosporangiaceae bacterium]